MKKNIETTHLEFDKSAFLIELIKHDNGLLYVEIAQTIFAENKTNRTIKINPSLLGDIIKILQNYHARVSIKHNEISSFLSEKDKGEIQIRYLKGISIKDISTQFDQSEELIEMVLRNRGIQIIPNEIPKTKWRRKRKK